MRFLKNNDKFLVILFSLFASQVQASHNVCDAKVADAKMAEYEYITFNHQSLKHSLEQRRQSGIDNTAIINAKTLQHEFGVFTKPTPLYTNNRINQFAKKIVGRNIIIYLKDETMNPTGSFKDRMPIHFYQKIYDDIQQKNTSNHELKVVAVSTGNHGRAVAYAANTANQYLKKLNADNKVNVYSEVTMSADALPHKKAAIANLGAKIRDHYPEPSLPTSKWKPIPNYDEAEHLVTMEANADPQHTLLLLHADKYAINGYAVIAEEMMQQAREKGINLAKIKPGEAMMLVPLGSGGILSGTEEVSARYPNVFSVGVTAAPADITYRSLKSCKLIRTANPYNGKLIVDGVMATPELFSLQRISELAKEVVLVKQEDAVYATALLKLNNINIEPTSGLPLAALLLGINKDYKNVRYAFIVLTGKNISTDMEKTIADLAAQGETVIYDYFKHRREEIAKYS